MPVEYRWAAAIMGGLEQMNEDLHSRTWFGASIALLGVVVLIGALGGLGWLVWSARAPGLDSLFKVSGRVKSAELQASPSASFTIDRAGTDFVLLVPDIQRLPQRDWPLQSVLPGDQVIAWYVPLQPDRNRGTLWQLYRGQLHVIALEDRARVRSEQSYRLLPWCVGAGIAGALLLGGGLMLRRHR